MNLKNYLSKGMTYEAYLELIEQLHSEQKVTGPVQTEELLQYSQLNKKRQDRLNKTATVQPEIADQLKHAIKTPMLWLTIAEGWCGDAAQIIPFIHALAAAIPQVQHRIILRDENLEVIDQFLTNGGRAIPKFILLDAQTGDVLGHWGPRPVAAQAIMNVFKADAKNMNEADRAKRKEEAEIELHTWYARNKGVDTQREFGEAVLAAIGVEV
jgi:hypothetical protein